MRLEPYSIIVNIIKLHQFIKIIFAETCREILKAVIEVKFEVRMVQDDVDRIKIALMGQLPAESQDEVSGLIFTTVLRVLRNSALNLMALDFGSYWEVYMILQFPQLSPLEQCFHSKK